MTTIDYSRSRVRLLKHVNRHLNVNLEAARSPFARLSRRFADGIVPDRTRIDREGGYFEMSSVSGNLQSFCVIRLPAYLTVSGINVHGSRKGINLGTLKEIHFRFDTRNSVWYCDSSVVKTFKHANVWLSVCVSVAWFYVFVKLNFLEARRFSSQLPFCVQLNLFITYFFLIVFFKNFTIFPPFLILFILYSNDFSNFVDLWNVLYYIIFILIRL